MSVQQITTLVFLACFLDIPCGHCLRIIAESLTFAECRFKEGLPGYLEAPPVYIAYLKLRYMGLWCNGSTAVSKTADGSSILSGSVMAHWLNWYSDGLENHYSERISRSESGVRRNRTLH